MPVVTLLNQKGGVGKTSTTHNLAGALAEAGRRVLVVDNDPQASLTQGFLGPQATRAIPPARTVAAVYSGAGPYPEQVIRASGLEGVDLLPGSRAATEFNVPLPERAGWAQQTCLAELLGQVEGYDLVLIDCPPNLHLCSWAALAASDSIIVPLQAEDYGAQGIIEVQESIDAVTAGVNPRLELLGYLLTMFTARMSICRLYEGSIRESYGPLVFATTVPMAADFKEAIAHRQTVTRHKPRGAAARSMRALAAEVLGRLAANQVIRGAA